jgi:GTPase SAR1 family protein
MKKWTDLMFVKKPPAKKVVCVGEAGVGKTCLIYAAVWHTFLEDSLDGRIRLRDSDGSEPSDHL